MNIYISVTTTRQRLFLLEYVITSISKQTIEPNAVFVNISRDPYLSDNGIDCVPCWLVKKNIFVNFVRNTGPYRKILPTINMSEIGENDLIITIDDDVIYEEGWLSKMVNAALDNPDAIVCAVARKIRKNLVGVTMGYGTDPVFRTVGSVTFTHERSYAYGSKTIHRNLQSRGGSPGH